MLTTWFVRDAPRVWLRSRTHVTGRKPDATPRGIHARNIYQPNCLHSILVSHLSQMASSGACGSVVERPLCISFGANLRKVRVSICQDGGLLLAHLASSVHEHSHVFHQVVEFLDNCERRVCCIHDARVQGVLVYWRYLSKCVATRFFMSLLLVRLLLHNVNEHHI